MNSQNNFVNRLVYFGAALSGNPVQFADEYQDLESFVLEASLNLSFDTRVTQAFIHWLARYGCLLSPSKMRRLIVSGTPYEPALLGVVIDIIQDNAVRLQNWVLLKPFLKKGKIASLFPNLPTPRKNLNPYFERWGLAAPSMKEPADKYLLPCLNVFKKCPELHYRAEGVSPVAADIRAFQDKNRKRTQSLYQIAKQIHHPRAQVNGFYRQLMRLQVLPARRR